MTTSIEHVAGDVSKNKTKSNMSTQPAPSAAAFDEHGFRDWVLRNMPDDTIIGSSAWWADHLTAWAVRFVKSAPQPSPTPQAAESVPAGEYPAMPEPFIGVQDRPWGGHAEVIRSAIGEDGVVSCYTANQMRAYVDADRAARAPADSGAASAAGAVAGPMDELAELSLLNRLIELGNKAAGAHATSNSDDGHKGTAAYVEWQELRAEMGELIRTAYAAAPTPPAHAADSVLEDAARLDWLALAGPTSICVVIDRPHDSEVEVATDDVTGYGKTLREALDAARKQGVKP